MAFKMNRPVIKGSALHKARSIVASAEQGPDLGLIAASKGLVPKGQAIDFSVDGIDIDYSKIDFGDRKEKKKKKNKAKKQDNPKLKVKINWPKINWPKWRRKKVGGVADWTAEDYKFMHGSGTKILKD